MRQVFMPELNKVDTIQGTTMPLFNHADLYADFAYLPVRGQYEYVTFIGKYEKNPGGIAFNIRC